MSNSLQIHRLQHARLLEFALSPGICSNSCPLSWWYHPTIWSSVAPFPSVFLSFRVFSKELALHITWLKYWKFSFSIRTSNEYSELISFRIDWFDLLAVQGTLNTLLQKCNLKASILQCCFWAFLFFPWFYVSVPVPVRAFYCCGIVCIKKNTLKFFFYFLRNF